MTPERELRDWSRKLAEDVWAISDGTCPDKDTLFAMIHGRMEKLLAAAPPPCGHRFNDYTTCTKPAGHIDDHEERRKGSVTTWYCAPAPTPAPPTITETGWLVERPGPEWASAWSGGFDWTRDSLKAIRFCRKSDANQVAEIFEFEDVRVTEHQWTDSCDSLDSAGLGMPSQPARGADRLISGLSQEQAKVVDVCPRMANSHLCPTDCAPAEPVVPEREPLDVQKFRDDLVDGLIIKESDGDPWPLTKSEADQIADELRKRLAAAPRAAGGQRETRLSTMLYRSLERLSIAIESCAKIGFQESSPTTNAHHASIWNDLNDAQKDAKLKLKHYETLAAAEPQVEGGGKT